jgi:outer membrane immunogenic protein
MRTLLAFISLLAAGGAASAADAPVVKDRSFKWEGSYAGVHAGFGAAKANWTWLADSFFGLTGDQVRHRPDGWIIGTHIGRNYQVGATVFGVEATLSATDLSASSVGNIPTDRLVTDINWLATVTGWLGYAHDRALYYAKAGYALGGVQLRLIDPPGPGISQSARLHHGWTAGAGFEYALASNWTLGVEYSYLRLGKGRHVAAGIDFAGNLEVTELRTTESLQSVMGRVSYRFGTQ